MYRRGSTVAIEAVHVRRRTSTRTCDFPLPSIVDGQSRIKAECITYGRYLMVHSTRLRKKTTRSRDSKYLGIYDFVTHVGNRVDQGNWLNVSNLECFWNVT